MTDKLTRRSFVKWSAVAAGGATIAGFAGCTPQLVEDTPASPGGGDPILTGGEWKIGACMNNCSCGSSRCLLKVYVKDGVPVQIKTDEDSEDSIEIPQKRACLRGRAQISSILSPARVKYPMKRKGWSPDNPNGEMRGKDTWERISWDEAMDYIADELKKTIDKYGIRSILSAAYSDIGDTYFDQVICLLNALGGAVHHELGTVSLGSWPAVEVFMMGGMLDAPDSLSILDSDLHFHFGNNWMANKGGNTAYQLKTAQEKGGKVIIVDPWLNQTVHAVADEWVPIVPGTDTAFALGMMHYMIEKNYYNREFLDKYCLGFDADHMPAGSDPKGNFKDYVLGTYDGEAKTPEWAEKICGVPAADIRRLADEINSAENVNFFAGQSTTKHPAGEMFGQAFYTLALMKGKLGTAGNYASWVGLHEGMSTAPYVAAGDISNGAEKNPVNPLVPPSLVAMPLFSEIADPTSWERVDFTECWQSVLDGEYGRDIWPGGKKKIDIHVIYTGGYENSLNSLPNTNAAIKAFRKMDFVFGANPYFCPSVQYADIIVPIATWWEKGNVAWTNNSDSIYWADQVIEPLFESKTEGFFAEGLAERMGVDKKVVNTMTDAERTLISIQNASYMTDHATMDYAPLITITQADIDAIGAKGEPQQGLMTFAEFKEKGVYKIERKIGDKLSHIPYAAYIKDPEGAPLGTPSGKFEIYCMTLAYLVNSVGYSTIAPIAQWQFNPEQGQGSQTDEYPLLLWTPHSLRRAHTVNDTVVSLREAFPQECFMSVVDAEKRGIKNGDIVLMSSPHGKVLRPAKIMPGVMPGSVALQDGAWTQIDEETGIDLGGNPNILQAPKASGQGSQSWTGTIVQVEKYNGSLTLAPDKERPIVLPVGVE